MLRKNEPDLTNHLLCAARTMASSIIVVRTLLYTYVLNLMSIRKDAIISQRGKMFKFTRTMAVVTGSCPCSSLV